MRRKATFVLLILLCMAGGLCALALAIKHEPRFYRQASVTPGPERKERSTEFFTQFMKVVNRFVDGQGKWSYTFKQEDANSYLVEDFVRLGDADALERVGISEPRIHFDDDRIRVAFRYGSGLWSTVVSYDVKVWLAPKEVNVMVFEIMNRQIGGVPIASQMLLNELKELARRRNIDVVWYRNDNNPVAVLRLPNSRARHFAQILDINVREGHLTIAGQCSDPGSQAAAPAMMAPVIDPAVAALPAGLRP